MLILLGFFVFSAGNSYVAAQTQIASLSWGLPDGGWENSVNRIGTPLQFPSTMVRMGDAGYLLIRIMLENDPANNAPWQQPRIKIDLPRGFDFSLTNVTTAARADSILIVEPGLTLRSLFTANTAPTGNAATGSPTNRTITLAYANGAGVNSKGITGTGVPANTLALGDSIVIKVRIRAIWEANPLNPGMVVVTLSSGANQSMMGIPIRQLQLNMTSPTLRIRPTPPYSETVLFDKILVDTNWVHVDIDAQQGHTRSAYINYAYNGTVVYLDSFKIDGKPLTILGSNGGAGVFHENRTSTTARVHIRLDQSNLLGNITDVPRTITFRATSNRGCKWELTPWIQNPLVPNTAPSGTASYDRWNTNVTILDLPGTRGFPLYNSQNNAITGANVGVFTNNSQPIIMRTTPRFNMDKLDDPTDLTNIRTPADAYTANHFYSFCWDGVTPNYATLALKEQNGQPSITCEFRTYLDYYTDLSWCEYYDTTQIYYRVTCPSKLNPAVDSIVVPVTRLLASDLDYYKRPCIEVQNNYPSSNA
ncbi:MAG: hypothetical protein LBU83_08265, partial [Bacteroidales bacterium]|nr:hypothetical protein [Bacteroidales bacterium]